MVRPSRGAPERIDGPWTPHDHARNYLPQYDEAEPPSFLALVAGAAARRTGHVRERAGTPATGAGAAERATCGTAASGTTASPSTRERAAAAAGGCGDRAHRRHPRRQARLHRDRGHAVAVRSIRGAVGGDLLHPLH